LRDGLAAIFMGVVDCRFCTVFCENVVLLCGFLMVKSWWNAGKRWSEDGLKSPAKDTPHFLYLFLRFPVLGKATT
jgi:hypothetical protein